MPDDDRTRIVVSPGTRWLAHLARDPHTGQLWECLAAYGNRHCPCGELAIVWESAEVCLKRSSDAEHTDLDTWLKAVDALLQEPPVGD